MSQLIKENVEHLTSKIKDYQDRINKHQEACKHEIVKGEYGANTGNWCKEDDSYWISAVCLDCHKHIHAESGTEEYYRLSNTGMIKSEYDSAEKLMLQELKRQDIMTKRGKGND